MDTFGWLGVAVLATAFAVVVVMTVWLYVSDRNIPPHS